MSITHYMVGRPISEKGGVVLDYSNGNHIARSRRTLSPPFWGTLLLAVCANATTWLTADVGVAGAWITLLSGWWCAERMEHRRYIAQRFAEALEGEQHHVTFHHMGRPLAASIWGEMLARELFKESPFLRRMAGESGAHPVRVRRIPKNGGHGWLKKQPRQPVT